MLAHAAPIPYNWDRWEAGQGGKKWWFDRWVHWWFSPCRRETPPKSQQPSEQISTNVLVTLLLLWKAPVLVAGAAPASISPSPILLVFWSHSFPIPLLRVSCDDAFDGEHLVCNSFLAEKIFKTCRGTVEARNLEWLLQQLAPPKSKSQALHQCQTCAIIFNAPAVQVTSSDKVLQNFRWGWFSFPSLWLWLKILKLGIWMVLRPIVSIRLRAASKFSASHHGFIVPGCQDPMRNWISGDYQMPSRKNHSGDSMNIWNTFWKDSNYQVPRCSTVQYLR